MNTAARTETRTVLIKNPKTMRGRVHYDDHRSTDGHEFSSRVYSVLLLLLLLAIFHNTILLDQKIEIEAG